VIADFVVGALEAEGKITGARDGFFFVFAFDFYGVGTVWRWAEFDVRIVFYVGFSDKFLIRSINRFGY